MQRFHFQPLYHREALKIYRLIRWENGFFFLQWQCTHIYARHRFGSKITIKLNSEVFEFIVIRVKSIAFLLFVWQYHEQKKIWIRVCSFVVILINSILDKPTNSTTFFQPELISFATHQPLIFKKEFSALNSFFI